MISDTQALQVETITRGAVPEDAMDLAVLKVRSDLRTSHEPALFARVMLAIAEDDGLAAIAQATVDLDSRRIRAHAAAESMRAAIELMCDKLRAQLDRAQLDRAEHGWSAWPVRRLPQPRRPPDEPSVVRHTSYGLPPLAGDEAIADLEMLDYEFNLFTERATEAHNRVVQVDPPLDLRDLEPLGATVTMSQVPAPRLELAEAQAKLTALGEPFMFFVNNQTGRGNLLYHRHDGGYGLITPVDVGG